MKHVHHIIPKHMGGTDDETNLVELTVQEHANAHRDLYLKHGKVEDYIAWKGLSGCLGKEELLLEKSRIGGKNNTRPKSLEHRKKISEANKIARPKGSPQVGGVSSHSEETKKRISTKMMGHANSKNHSSDEYRKRQSESMKLAWQKRKQRSVG